MKHTPAPWLIEEEPADEEYWVTRVHYRVGPAKIVYSMEDATLIAATLDLLAALHAALDEEDANIAAGFEPSDWYAQARAAIAKTVFP